ncbi:Dihydrolipoamide succinyltransferase [Trifolium repens]|nr:Dihydrolipoamide succinyltransferase [Trifolium repens]
MQLRLHFCSVLIVGFFAKLNFALCYCFVPVFCCLLCDKEDDVDVVVPTLAESIEDGILAKFPKRPGDRVNVDEPIVQIEIRFKCSTISTVTEATVEYYEEGLQACNEAAKTWMTIPAPKRGEIVRQR